MAENKKKVLLLYIKYPLAMGTYFQRALERRDDVNLKVVGPYTGAFIPWLGGMHVLPKYAIPPDITLPYPMQMNEINYGYVKAHLGDWVPDLVINVDAGLHWREKPSDGIAVTIATDPHVLNYDYQRTISDKFFNMQKVYSQPNDIYLPYAYDPTVFYRVPDSVVDVDACLVGMPYPQRIQWVEALQRKGLKVLFENGPIFDEARALYSRAEIGLNWSSLHDLNARVFEIMAMGLCPVINRVPDLPEFFKEDFDYLGFSNIAEGVEKVLFAKENIVGSRLMGMNAYKKVAGHTYDTRIQQIFEECGL